MAILTQFSLPALQNDFPDDPAKSLQLKAAWSTNVSGWTAQAILGNPWNSTWASYQDYYYNLLETDVPLNAEAVQVAWIAFPNRLTQYFGQGASPPNPYNYTSLQLWQMGDTGVGIDGNPLPSIPATRCPEADWKGTLQPYGPYGPRGWLDEYCEWSVTRNSQNTIVRIDFTCENPEYYNTLWSIDPDRVAQVYQQALNWEAPPERQITVETKDLYLTDPKTGAPVIDPATGRPAYNPLNKWNRGPISFRRGAASTGGAMHLTSTPNTLQTEMGLAGGATVQRKQGNSQPQPLICCSQYGQNYRHSDPHIGQTVNLAVSAGFRMSLADPVGLYIQTPQNINSILKLPSDPHLPPGAMPSDCWHIVRGQENISGQGELQTIFSGNCILHAVFQIPKSWRDAGVSFEVGDIRFTYSDTNKTYDVPLQQASMLSELIHVALFGLPITTSAKAPAFDCVGTPDNPAPQPLQIMYVDIWDACYSTPISNPSGQPMNLASNTTITAPIVEQGSKQVLMALTFAPVTGESATPIVAFDADDIVVTVTDMTDVTYAVPGNSYPGPAALLRLTLDVSPDAKLGLRGITIKYPDQPANPPPVSAPAFLNVIAASGASAA